MKIIAPQVVGLFIYLWFMSTIYITKKTVFIGAGEVGVGLTADEHDAIQDDIEITEDQILEELLGAKLYNEFQTDLAILGTGSATANKWVDLLEGTTYEPADCPDEDVNYKGLRRMLKLFIHWEYSRHYPVKRVSTGPVSINKENSSPATPATANARLVNKYNIGVGLYKKAQDFVDEFECVQSDFDSFVEGPAGTYTMTITPGNDDPQYAVIGDTMEVDLHPGEEFTVTAVDYTGAGTITMTGTAGLGTGSGEYEYKPFDLWVQTDKETAGIY